MVVLFFKLCEVTLHLVTSPAMFFGCQALTSGKDIGRVIVPVLMILPFDSGQNVVLFWFVCVCFFCMQSQLQVQGGWIWTK